MKQRIDYIDRMKGLAIFLVVMGHVYGMVFVQPEDVANHGWLYNLASRMERVLDYVGTRTLDVYVIHYFFISQIHLSEIAKDLEATDNALLVFVLTIFLSVIVTTLAIGVGNILHHGTWIKKIVYGK